MLEQLARAPSRQLTRRPEARPDLTGRRSGTRYAAVNYLLLGREVLITTDSSWWHNLDVGPLAELRPRGRTLRPTSEVIRDHDLVAEVLAACATTRLGPAPAQAPRIRSPLCTCSHSPH